jgi:hypothetical protein
MTTLQHQAMLWCGLARPPLRREDPPPRRQLRRLLSFSGLVVWHH